MKQTKKLTRNLRELLDKNGIKKAFEYRFVRETRSEYVFYHDGRKEILKIGK